MYFKFGSPGAAPMFSPRALKWTVIILWCLGIAVIAAVFWVTGVRAGCSLPPKLPLDVRRDAICALLNRQADCRVRVKDTIGATILSDEQDYSVWVGGEFIGSFPIANGEPIDPSLLTKEIVDYHLQFQTGTAELQQRFKAQLHCRRVAYVDRVLEWTLGETKVLIGCAS